MPRRPRAAHPDRGGGGDATGSASPELERFLRRAVARLRWVALAALLALTLAGPAANRAGPPAWLLVLLFAGASAGLQLLQDRPGRARPRLTVALAALDLAAAAVVYALSREPAGPLFVPFFLAVGAAAEALSLRGALGYTAGAAALAAAIAPDSPLRAPPGDVRALGTRLVMLAIVGAGMAILTRRLIAEERAARAGHAEAARLETIERLRTDFILTISHDLRTPLTAARTAFGLLEASAADRLDADERALLASGRRNTDRLARLIDDLLTLNQLEAGALRLAREPLDLRAVADAAVAAVAPLARAKGQALASSLYTSWWQPSCGARGPMVQR